MIYDDFYSVISVLGGIVFFFVVLIVLFRPFRWQHSDDTESWRSSRAEDIGLKGERNMARFLSSLPASCYRVYNDLLLCDGSFTHQIDHVVISRFGVFVIETKNIHGKIYGSGNAEFWMQYLPDRGYRRHGYTQKYTFRNPVWQNDGHIKVLRKLVFDDDVPIYPIVAFSNKSELFVTTEYPVLHMYETIRYICSYKDEVLTDEQVGRYGLHIAEAASQSSAARQEHLHNIRYYKSLRDTAVADGRCPRCGGKLLLHVGRFGPFYGCANFPGCRYIRNIH